MGMKIFAVVYGVVMLLLTAVQVWLCVICLPFVVVALFTIPWGAFFALAILASAFDPT